MFTAKVQGTFVQTQSVEADSAEDAEAKFLAGEGEVLENKAEGTVVVAEVASQDEEEVAD